jgi:hypothetical protein
MEYIFIMRELDEIIDGEELITNKDVTVHKRIDIVEDEKSIRFNAELDMIFDEEKEEISLYKKINNAFKEIELDKNTKEIININEIVKNWKDFRNNLLYDTSSSAETMEFLLAISRHFENTELLKYALNYCGVIPYFLNINLIDFNANNNAKRELKLYNLLSDGAMVYDTQYIVSESYVGDKKEYEFTFSGKGETEEGAPSLAKEIHHIIELPEDKQFFVSSEIRGKYLFLDGFEKLYVEIKFLVEQMKNLKKFKFAEKTLTINLEKNNRNFIV